MHKIVLFMLPLLSVACVSSGIGMNHHLVQDTRLAFEEGVTKNFAKCAPVAFAEAEAHLMMAAHEFSEGNMDRSNAQELKQKADMFMAQAQEKCAPPILTPPMPINFVKTIVKKDPVKIQESFKESVYFETKKTALSELAEQTLEALVQRILDKTRIDILVSGHADERGKDDKNQQLSCSRTDAASLYLVKLGINKQDIRNHCYGESKPISSGHDETAWQKNRRVDVQVTAKQAKESENNK